ncbi:MAG: hypothetical protein ACI85N_002133 [Gammaproteobacteria bacterium]|jgi:uncharacterized protein YbaP (TraB family)
MLLLLIEYIFMCMNNIVFYLLCLLVIPASSYADPGLSDECKDFRSFSEKTTANVSSNQTTPFKKGLLWKIVSPEGKVNYLFGTMHSQDYAVSKFPPEVRLALVKSKTLILETIPNEEANQAFIDMMYFKDGQRLDNMLEAEFFNELKNWIKDYGVEPEKLKHLKPWAAFSLTGRPKPVRAPSLESNLLRFAQQHRLKVKSLETMQEILSALDSLLMEDQLIILKDTICNHNKIIRETKTLVDLYVNRDLAGLVAFNKQAHYDEAVFDRFMQSVLYDRNIVMLERIEKAFAIGNAFVAVGASHLADEKGLLQNLSNKGYRITSVY